MTSTVEAVAVEIDASLVELARAALADELGGAPAGECRGAHREDDVAVSLMFTANEPGYRGWEWTVTVAVVDPQRPTVSEVVLLPGPGALLPPEWVPWADRVRHGDLGPGDIMPPPADDPRLAPAYLQSDDPAVEAVAGELGLGRVRVMSRLGREELAERLHEGDFGPRSAMAQAAPAHCDSCGFYLPLAGMLGQISGVCGNDLSPADSRMVDAGYGCGGHSETVALPQPLAVTGDSIIDDLVLEVHERVEDVADTAGTDDLDAAAGPTVSDDPAEPIAAAGSEPADAGLAVVAAEAAAAAETPGAFAAELNEAAGSEPADAGLEVVAAEAVAAVETPDASEAGPSEAAEVDVPESGSVEPAGAGN